MKGTNRPSLCTNVVLEAEQEQRIQCHICRVQLQNSCMVKAILKNPPTLPEPVKLEVGVA